jgi:tetratricopeptide (TPR) repeat protein
MWEEAAALYAKVGIGNCQAKCLRRQGWIRSAQKRPAEALEKYNQSIKLFTNDKYNMTEIAFAYLDVANVHWYLGKKDEALLACQRGLKICDQFIDRWKKENREAIGNATKQIFSAKDSSSPSAGNLRMPEVEKMQIEIAEKKIHQDLVNGFIEIKVIKRFERDRAYVRINYGNMLFDAGQSSETIKQFRAARPIITELPENATLRVEYNRSLKRFPPAVVAAIQALGKKDEPKPTPTPTSNLKPFEELIRQDELFRKRQHDGAVK